MFQNIFIIYINVIGTLILEVENLLLCVSKLILFISYLLNVWLSMYCLMAI